jgi:hypothetical protein
MISICNRENRLYSAQCSREKYGILPKKGKAALAVFEKLMIKVSESLIQRHHSSVFLLEVVV